MVQYSTEGRTNERSEPFCENDSSFTAPPSMSGLATHNLPTGRATFTVTGMLAFNDGARRVPLTSRYDRSSVLVKLRKWTRRCFSSSSICNGAAGKYSRVSMWSPISR